MNQEVTQYSLKYRPMYFRDVFGQDKVVKALQDRIKTNNYPQVVCLKGPYGTGKSTLAYILAAAMIGHDEDGEPDWTTPEAKSILSQSFDRDVMLLDASRWSGKDAMVDFTTSIQAPPLFSKSGKRICIIEEADQASNASMLSLLKILESNKAYNHFILLSMEDKGIPQSVLSRCQVFNIKPLEKIDIMKGLKHVMELDGKWTDDSIPMSFRTEGLAAIADAARGSMRTAVQGLESALVNKAYTAEQVSGLFDVIDEVKSWKILDGLLAMSKDEGMWHTIVGLKTGDEVNHLINYISMMLSEALVCKETGFSYDEGNYGRLMKMGSNPNAERLYYCLTLSPQMTKAYIRTSDLVGCLAGYYKGLDFRPGVPVVANVSTNTSAPVDDGHFQIGVPVRGEVPAALATDWIGDQKVDVGVPVPTPKVEPATPALETAPARVTRRVVANPVVPEKKTDIGSLNISF